jgi:hypothetical protein
MATFPGISHVALTVTDLAASAFGVANRAELESWQARLEELGIPHGGIGRRRGR